MRAISRLSRMVLPLLVVSCVASDDAEPPPLEPMPSEPSEPSQPPVGETPAQVAERLLTTWQDCMQLEDFQTARMAPSWSQMTASTGQRCEACHQDGIGGFIATANEQRFFETLKTDRYYLMQYVTPDVVAGTMIVNDRSVHDAGSGAVPHAEHPRYDPASNGGMATLQHWYDLAQARVVAECMPAPQ